MAKIAILGLGFGTALAVHWDKYGHEIVAWSKFKDEVDTILNDGQHKKLLPGVIVPPTISLETDLRYIKDSDFVVFAIPSKFVREVARLAKPYIKEGAVIVNMGKGFEESSKKRLSQVLSEEIPDREIVVLTGPSHAEEIGRFQPTTIVASSENPESAVLVQKILQTDFLRIYVNDDLIGCELGGALKNSIALCCGIIEGMGLGDNTLAAVMTRGIAEISRLGVAMGANWKTFAGLTGIGDLIVTCTSTHSRNHRAGILIGKGMKADEAVSKVGTVEGYGNTKTALELAKEYSVEVPIIEELYKVCYEGLDPRISVPNLMNRPSRNEREKFWLDE
ncbi:MAG: NAD(P)-dependent glycerol-3-phosphate dehydrogenase [Clostridiales bacterium]|nr:NAD(P)-dependent glycerol-3-phosphate dehydrogenase [Clostridiales bacterium]